MAQIKDVPTFHETEDGQVVATEMIPYRRDQQEKRLASAERSLNLFRKDQSSCSKRSTHHLKND
jgi:hypothetical protein